MQRPIFTLLVFCVLLGIAVIGYTQWSTPTPPPAPATLTATSQSTATMTPTPVPILTTDHLALPPFTLSLGAPWSVLVPTDGAWSTKLQQLAAEKPMLSPYWAALGDLPANGTHLALTWPPPATADLLLVAALIPAEALTLQGYLAAAKEELAQSRLLLGAAVTVSQAEIRYDLREDHIPVAIVRYTLPTSAYTNASTGYQAALLDKTGTQLLLLTALTHEADPSRALAQIDALLATIQEE